MRETEQRCSDSGSESSTSSSSFSSEDDSGCENSRKRGRSKRKRSISISRGNDSSSSSSSSSSSESSEAQTRRWKSRTPSRKERKRSHRKDISVREEKKETRRRSMGSGEKHGRKEKHRRKHKHERGKHKKKGPGPDSFGAAKDEVPVQLMPKSTLQVMNEAQEQQKEIARRNVEMAKARLASGELQRMKHEQLEMHRLYGVVDWREKKKLQAEKSRLERTIAAGQKLASIEERENGRMEAFRVALGLPTAEAQRQAEWRAEATRALADADALRKANLLASLKRVPSRSQKVIGPQLPK